MKNEVDTYGAPVFAPDYGATVLAAKMCTNSNELARYIRFLCPYFTPIGFGFLGQCGTNWIICICGV